MVNQIFEINVDGIKCVGCKGKIEKEMRKLESVKYVSINVVLNQIIVEVDQAINTIDDINDLLTKMKFKVLSCNEILEQNQEKRIMTFLSFSQKINISEVKKLENLKGIEKAIIVERTINKHKGYELKITYNCLLIKALEINTKIKEEYQQYDFQYKNELQNVLASLITENKQLNKREIMFIAIFLVFIIFDLFSNFIAKLSSIHILQQKFNLYLIVVVLFSFSIVFYFGIPIYRDSIKVYRSFRILNMNTLVTISSFASFFYQFILFIQYINCDEDKFKTCLLELVRAIETPAIFITIVLVGKYIEEMAKSNIRNKTFQFNEHFYHDIAHELTYINPKNRKMAILSETQINQGLLEKNDLFKVKKDDYLLCDSIVMQGQVTIKQNDNFGHQIDITKKQGDTVRSGSFVKSEDDSILKAQNNLEQSFLFKLVKEMSNSLNQKFQYYNLVDRFIKYFIPCICLISIFTIFFWILVALVKKDHHEINFNFVIQRTISILVVSCPCAFGLAIPMITAIVLNQALKNGILIKNVEKISLFRNAQHILFDKNGTLTEDCNEIECVFDNNQDINQYQVLMQLEKDQKHKIAQLIYSKCQQKVAKQNLIVNSFTLENKKVLQNGIKAQTLINDQLCEVAVGNYAFCKENLTNNEIDLILNYHEKNQSLSKSCIYYFQNNELCIVFQIQKFDSLREEAIELINKLNDKYQKDIYILSGDQKQSVLDIAENLNIKSINCFYEIDSQSKKETIRKLKQRGDVVMIGDGLNDILSLSEADFGISFNASSNLNLISSDFVFLTKNLKLILSLIKISKLTFYFTWINIFWAFIYNIIMIPFAGGYFYFITSFQLTPAYSSFAMLLSSVLIILTSFSIKLFDLDYRKMQII